MWPAYPTGSQLRRGLRRASPSRGCGSRVGLQRRRLRLGVRCVRFRVVPHRARRSLTTAARASVRRSRRTARRPAARPGRRATERDDRSTPTRPSRPPGGDYLCLGESESIRVAGRDLTRSATRLPGSAVRRATAPRSTPAAAARARRPVLAHHRHDLIDRRRIGRIHVPLVPWRPPGVVAGHRRG